MHARLHPIRTQEASTQTLPLAIYSEVAAGDMEGAYGYVYILVAISFAVIFLMNYFTLKGTARGKGRKK